MRVNKEIKEIKENIPALRFKGYFEEWKIKSLENITTSISNNSLSRAKLNYKFGAAKNIHYGDILLRFDNVLDANRQDLPFITEESDVEKLMHSALQVGDIIFSDAAEDITVGKSVELVKTNKYPVFAGLHTITFRPTYTFAKGYLGYYTNSEAYRSQLYPLMQGTKVLSLSRNSLKSTYIKYPKSLLEQQKISEFFNQFDINFNKLKDEIKSLNQLKKVMLRKMFPQGNATEPEIRFKGFSGKWEEKELGEITQITMGQSPLGMNYTDNPNDHILVQGNADLKNGFVVPRVWTTQVTKTANAGDLIFGVRAPVGTIGRTNFNVVLGRGVAGIQGDDFIFYTLKKMELTGYWTQFSAGSTFESINSDCIMSALVFVPTCKNEQQKIGKYFQKLDQLINLKNNQINKLKQIKKTCLTKMFV